MKPSCPYCGNNPVPHLLYWQNESLNILLTPLRQKILFNPLTRFLKKRGLDIKFARVFLFLAEKLRVIRLQGDIAKCKVARAKVLWQEAGGRGVKMRELLFFGHPIDVYSAEKSNSKKILFSGLPRPGGYINHWLDLMDDKWLFKKILMENHLPAPAGKSCGSFAQALEVFKKIRKPVIIKPRAGSRGRHSTTFARDEKDLRRAFKIAKQLCYWVIVEEQLFGPVYRATLVNFELCGVLRGDPPQVTGDGEHNISQLIKIKNESAHRGVKDIVMDGQMERFLERSVPTRLDSRPPRLAPGETGQARQVYRQPRMPINGRATVFGHVPDKNQVISLSEKIGVNYGGSSSEDFEICHPENKELFVKAAKALGDPLVGFDFIIPDIAKSWKEQKCGFIEVNSLPFINLHHDPLLGKPVNVAKKVWEMVGF